MSTDLMSTLLEFGSLFEGNGLGFDLEEEEEGILDGVSNSG
jgi:hypothetical protein